MKWNLVAVMENYDHPQFSLGKIVNYSTETREITSAEGVIEANCLYDVSLHWYIDNGRDNFFAVEEQVCADPDGIRVDHNIIARMAAPGSCWDTGVDQGIVNAIFEKLRGYKAMAFTNGCEIIPPSADDLLNIMSLPQPRRQM